MRTFKEILGDMSQTSFDVIASRDPCFFGERVLGIYIKDFHREWVKMILENQFTCIIAPTGHGKSLVAGIMMVLWYAYYKKNMDMLIISNSLEQSTKILERIKDYIEENEMLQILIPEKHDAIWSQTELHVTTKCKIYCKPYNPNIRSYHVHFALADEIAQYREHNIFFKWVMTRVTSKNGKLVAISTFIDEHDLAHKLIKKDSGFISKVYRAIDEKENTLFPELYSYEQLQSLKSSMGSLPFAREYMSDTTTVEDALYKLNSIAECCNEKLGFNLPETEHTFMGCDIAMSESKTADYSVFTIVENIGRKTFIRRIDRHRGMPLTFQKKRIKELATLYKVSNIFLDSSSIGESFVQELRQDGLSITPCDFSYKNRNDYLVNLARYVEDKRIIIPFNKEDMYAYKLGEELCKELSSFIITKTPTGMVTYKSTAAHDDMVISLALSIKGASLQREFADAFFAE